jgi:hypothetical protein
LTTAGPAVPGSLIKPLFTTSTATTTAFVIVKPVLLPYFTSPSFAAAAAKALADEMAGTLTTNTSVTAPTNYAVCSYHISWSNLVFSTSANMWAGVLDPAPPFQNEFGQLAWVLVDAQVPSGSNAVSLDSLSVTSASNDGNQLGSTTTFSGLSYTPLAFAVQADGTVITNGSASQQGKRVLVLVLSTMFNGGGTQNGLDQVMDWVDEPIHTPYDLSWTAQIIGDDTTQSSATVTTGPGPSVPVLAIAQSSGSLLLWVTNAVPSQTYQLYSSTVLNPASWQLMFAFTGTNSVSVPATGTNQFFSVAVQ